MREPAQVAAGRPVLELELDLLDREPGPNRVDRHPRLDAEAHCDGEHAARGPLPTASAGPRAARASRRPHRRRISERAARLASPKPPPSLTLNTATARSESRAASPRRSPRRSASQRSSGPGSTCSLCERQRLSLAAAGEPDHPGPGRLGDGRGAVARAVVGDHDRRGREVPAQGLDGLADPAPPRHGRRRGR